MLIFSFVIFEPILDDFQIVLDALGVSTDGIFVLRRGDNSRHSNQQQSFEEPFEEIIGIDDPQRGDVVDGPVKFEEQLREYF